MNQESGIQQWRRGVVVFLILNSLFLIPIFAHAAILPDCDPVPRAAGTPTAPLLPPCGVAHLFELLANIYNFLLGLAALVAMFFMVYGGMRMLYFSYMEDSAKELEEGKLTVRRAIGGFIIIALAYLLVNTVLLLVGLKSTGVIADTLRSVGLFKLP